MLIAGMVSDADIFRGLACIAGVWFGPPLFYVVLALTTEKENRPSIVWPVIWWIVGAPAAFFIYAFLSPH
jgi:hypothetical protein